MFGKFFKSIKMKEKIKSLRALLSSDNKSKNNKLLTWILNHYLLLINRYHLKINENLKTYFYTHFTEN